jgi:hypothetical protein
MNTYDISIYTAEKKMVCGTTGVTLASALRQFSFWCMDSYSHEEVYLYRHSDREVLMCQRCDPR